MGRGATLAVVASVLALSGCARQVRPAREPVGEGLASFYGPGLAGNLTASGERFDPLALTAAHRHLPFGTCLRVRNLANGLEVEVRVNDRGPYAGKRVLDVSQAAAKRLQMLETGVTRVRFWRCD